MDKKAALRALELEMLSEPVAREGEPNVIFFKKGFANSPKTYTYAAVQSGGLWFVTGTQALPGKTWGDLLHWMGGDAEIWWASDFELMT